MSQELILLSYTAISLGFLHTLLGPDHYLPFIAMAQVGKWSKKKTIWVTIIAGIGHVLGTIILGVIGVAIGTALNILEIIESYRGVFAGWLLVSFGMVYLVWAINRLIRKKKHTHLHTHPDGVIHSHTHNHSLEHSHVHKSKNGSNLTPWILFVIFVFGPCETLIPLLIYPAANIGISGILIVVSLFAFATIVTMLAVVLISLQGFSFLSLNKFEKYNHIIAGVILTFSGLGIIVLGL